MAATRRAGRGIHVGADSIWISRDVLFDALAAVSPARWTWAWQRATKSKAGAFCWKPERIRFTLHVDAFNRSTADVSVPVSLACSKPGSPAVANKICNSASETKSGAVGASAFFDQGYIGCRQPVSQ